MDLRTPVCELLGCDVPIVLAGMGGVARSELAAAVSEAGGFGFMGMVREPPELITSEVAAVRARTGRAFGVNLIPAATRPELLAAELDACLAAEVPVVALFWDLAAEIVARLRAAGVRVVCQVGSAHEARAAEDAGAEIIIAQGVEAGGHVRGMMPLMDLLPQVLAAVRIPVLAAGGLVDGDDLAAVMRLALRAGCSAPPSWRRRNPSPTSSTSDGSSKPALARRSTPTTSISTGRRTPPSACCPTASRAASGVIPWRAARPG